MKEMRARSGERQASEAEGPAERLDALVERRAVGMSFQPILDALGRELLGFEALARGPVGSPLHEAGPLFDLAARCGRLARLEAFCTQTAVEGFQRLALPGRLFLNVSPAALIEEGADGRLVALLEVERLDPARVVLELSERHPVGDYDALRRVLSRLRATGCQFAIDDLGSGYSGLRAWSQLAPEFVKIDMHFVRGIDEDAVKRQFVHSIQAIAESLGCRAIAEGIETAEEYGVVSQLGVHLVQGHLFGRPEPVPATERHGEGLVPPRPLAERRGTARFNETIGSLLRPTPPVHPSTPAAEVADRFRDEPLLAALPVVEGGVPVGLVERMGLLQVFAGRYGRDLFGRKPVSLLMNAEPIVVDAGERLEVVSERITTAGETDAPGRFIITDGGRYVGVGSVLDLLKQITEQQVRNARYANPLTLLPGNVPIAETIERLLVRCTDFTACYFDIDNFKPYNDVYGYDRGDALIRFLADTLVAVANAERDFVGHVGGDDFIVVFRSEDWQERCARVFERFDAGRADFYATAHLERGGIEAVDRRGERFFYGLVSLSAGAVPVSGGRLYTQHEVAQRASEAKSQAKKQDGSALFIDRRGPSQPAH